jgi:hypothetical protein
MGHVTICEPTVEVALAVAMQVRADLRIGESAGAVGRV